MAGKTRQSVPSGYVSGEYAVGTKCFTVIDPDRKNVVDDGRGERRIAVRMYYPVRKEDTAGHKYAKLFTDAKKAAIRKGFHTGDISDDANYAEFYEDIPPADGVKFPLIMFSMGIGSYVESNTYLLCALASHGYIIASVGHAHEAVENDYDDGSTDLLDKRIKKVMYTNMIGAVIAQTSFLRKKVGHREAVELFDAFQNKYTPYLKVRTAEWRKDAEKALEAVKERYSDNIDLTCGVGASGHSLGGCLAYNLCRYNNEFRCGINIDGALFGDYPDNTMTRPFCQISCMENINCETRPFLDTEADTYSVIFDDMKHIGFTDAKFYIPVRLISGKLPPEEMFRHLEYCHITFFDKYLKGADVMFDSLPSDKVTYTKIR